MPRRLLQATLPAHSSPCTQASEYLFYESNSADGEAGPEVLDREQVERVVTWLRSCGVPDAQIPAVLTSHPTLLAYDVATRLQPLSEYLSSLGVSGSRLATAIQQRPTLLGLSPSRQMKLMVDYLLSVDTPLDVVIERLLTTL